MTSAGDASNYASDAAPREQTSLFAILRRRFLIVVLTTLLCGGAAAAFAYANRDSYGSTAKLLFDQTIGPELSALEILPTAPDADNLAQNNVRVVDSRRVAVATAEELRAGGGDRSADDVQDDVEVTADKDSEVVEVSASDTSAEGAALLARTYSETAVRLAREDQQARAQATLANVEEQLGALSATERSGTVGNSLRRDAQKLKALADVGTGSPRIIQNAFVPTSKSGNPLQTILLGLLFGVMLGIGLALVREQADHKLHRNDEVSAAFDAPVLVTVPRSRALKRHRPFGDLPPAVSEAFRMLQMNLRFGQEGPVRSVIVTSSRTREGKTTVAWNLASAAASAGMSVALLEADMRRPTIARRYGLEAGPGLAEALRGEESVAAVVQRVNPVGGATTSNGRSSPLHVVVAGEPPPDPWALTQSPAMVRVLEQLQGDHDLVVVDTPPIPHVSDAISLLRRVDGVLLTASVNSTSGPEASRLRDQLQSLEARVIGVVANGGANTKGYSYPAPVAANGGAPARAGVQTPDRA